MIPSFLSDFKGQVEENFQKLELFVLRDFEGGGGEGGAVGVNSLSFL